MKENILDILKLLAQKRRELSVCEVGENDFKYNKAINRLVEMGNQYEKLGLKADDKTTVDELLKAMADANAEEVNLSYLLGMKDCIMLLDKLGLF